MNTLKRAHSVPEILPPVSWWMINSVQNQSESEYLMVTRQQAVIHQGHEYTFKSFIKMGFTRKEKSTPH